VNVTGTFSSGNLLGLQYQPTNNISGATVDWFIDVWTYLDNKTNISLFRISVVDVDDRKCTVNDISGNIQNGVWYHFEHSLIPSSWDYDNSCNVTKGIKRVEFYLVNETPDLVRTLKIDGLHFRKKYLIVKTFPEEHINAISFNKFDTMRNLSYDELKKTIGENYKLTVQIDGETYGGLVNQSANAVCYQNPSIIQYKNGTIKKIVPKLCVWK
jgi:hypothetical protein